MTNRQKHKLTRLQKLLLVVLGAIIVWQVLLTDTVGNAVLGFLLGGEVPGTDTVVPPDMMLWGVVGIVAAGIVVFIVRSFMARRRVRRLIKAEKAVAATPIAELESEPVSEEELEPEPETVSEIITPEFAELESVSDVEALEEPKTPGVVPRRTTWKRQMFARYWQLRTRLKPLRARLVAGLVATGAGLHKVAVYAIGVYELVRIRVVKFLVWLRPQLRAIWGDIKFTFRELVRVLGRGLQRLQQWSSRQVHNSERVQMIQEVKINAKTTLKETKQAAKTTIIETKQAARKVVAKHKPTRKRTPKPAGATKPSKANRKPRAKVKTETETQSEV